MEHIFTNKIKEKLNLFFPNNAEQIFEKSDLIQYINFKTKSANRGSKSRSSFANLYAIYVLVEDYINNNFHQNNTFSTYSGGEFSTLLKRQRELPFGEKLQNHALNSRVNSEFQKFFPSSIMFPIIRDQTTTRYWINEGLLKITIDGTTYNISESIIAIIDSYIETKQNSFRIFIEACEEIKTIAIDDQEAVSNFIFSLLAPNTDARLFEIVSFAILKNYYKDTVIYWGYNPEKLECENLKLYKTGRTNANDGGIDFVMRPLGRFFQVTETLDFKKYFLDIDKIQKFPITFVIKSEEDTSTLIDKIRQNALSSYSIISIVDTYMQCIEEIINLSELRKRFLELIENGNYHSVLDEIILQNKVEFNI